MHASVQYESGQWMHVNGNRRAFNTTLRPKDSSRDSDTKAAAHTRQAHS